MAVEFGQEKSGAGSFRGSGDLCLTKAAPLFVCVSGGEENADTERQRQRKSVTQLFQDGRRGPLGVGVGVCVSIHGHTHVRISSQTRPVQRPQGVHALPPQHRTPFPSSRRPAKVTHVEPRHSCFSPPLQTVAGRRPRENTLAFKVFKGAAS